MNRILNFLPLIFLPLNATAATQTLHGHVPKAVPHLQATERMPALARLNLAISLPLRNTNDLARLIQDLYNPASPRFHHYLTPTQFTEQFGPTPADYESVKSFSKANGFEILGTHPNRTLVDVRASVENIENAFHLHLNRYPHPVENRTFFSPDTEPSLNLTAQVLYISGLSDFIKPHPTIAPFKPDNSAPLGSPMGVGSATNGAFIGKDFRAAYASNVTLTGAGESVGLFELGGGYYPSDITTYESEAGLPNVPITPVLLDGYDGSPGVWEVNTEVSLDIEMAISMAPGLDQVLVYEGYLPDSILSQMATDDIAKQLSASWVYGIDAESQQLYQQFATQGQSFFNSSGDGGAWGNSISTPCDDPYITIAGWLDCGVRGRCVWPAAFHVSMDVKRNEHFRRNWTVTCHHQCPITADRNLHNRDQQRVRRRCRCACSPCHCDCVQRDGKL